MAIKPVSLEVRVALAVGWRDLPPADKERFRPVLESVLRDDPTGFTEQDLREFRRAFVRREDARSEKLKEAGAEIFIGDLFDLSDLRRALAAERPEIVRRIEAYLARARSASPRPR